LQYNRSTAFFLTYSVEILNGFDWDTKITCIYETSPYILDVLITNSGTFAAIFGALAGYVKFRGFHEFQLRQEEPEGGSEKSSDPTGFVELNSGADS